MPRYCLGQSISLNDTCCLRSYSGGRGPRILRYMIVVLGSIPVPGTAKSKVDSRLVITSGRCCATSQQVAVYLYQTHVSGRSLWVTSLGLTFLEGVPGSPPLDPQNDRSLHLGLTSARFQTLLLLDRPRCGCRGQRQ